MRYINPRLIDWLIDKQSLASRTKRVSPGNYWSHWYYKPNSQLPREKHTETKGTKIKKNNFLEKADDEHEESEK